MAITREQKEAQIAQLVEDFGKAKMTVLANYQGLSVEEMQELRRELHAQDSNFRVIKNTLIQLAATKHSPFKDIDSSVFDGPIGLAFGYEDEVAPAQVIAKFAKAHPQIEFVCALNESGEYFDAEQIQRLAELPSKEQLLGQLVGTIAAPLSGFITVLSGNMRGIVQVLSQFRDQQSNA